MSDSVHLLVNHPSSREGVLLVVSFSFPFSARSLGNHPKFHELLRAHTLGGSADGDKGES